MRRITIVTALLFMSCATTKAPPPATAKAEPAPAKAQPAATSAGQPISVEMASATATRAGAVLTETRYSEQDGDAAITGKQFAAGVITLTGVTTQGKGSAYAGIGLNFPIDPDGKPVNASKYRAVTFHLASAAPRALRLRISGTDEGVRNSGCYPVYMQAVGPEMKAYTIPLDKFQAEGWCGAKGVSSAVTVQGLYGFEVADVTVSKNPTTFSIGTVTLEP